MDRGMRRLLDSDRPMAATGGFSERESDEGRGCGGCRYRIERVNRSGIAPTIAVIYLPFISGRQRVRQGGAPIGGDDECSCAATGDCHWAVLFSRKIQMAGDRTEIARYLDDEGRV